MAEICVNPQKSSINMLFTHYNEEGILVMSLFDFLLKGIAETLTK